MNKNRLIYITVVVALAVMFLLTARAVVATNTVVSQGNDQSDYALRHPDVRPIVAPAAPDMSDYFQRHRHTQIVPVTPSPDLSDYYLRHPSSSQ